MLDNEQQVVCIGVGAGWRLTDPVLLLGLGLQFGKMCTTCAGRCCL